MKRRLGIILVFAWILSGCGGSQDVQVHVSLPAAFVDQGQIDRIVFRTTAADITTPVISVLNSPYATSLDGNTVTSTLTLPIGNARTIEVIAPLNGSTQSALIGKVTVDIEAPVTGALTLPAIPMFFYNYATDVVGTGDVLSTSASNPDIAGFKMFLNATTTTSCPADTVEFDIDLNNPFVEPVSIETFRAIIEFDTDDNATTGSTQSRIETYLSRISGDRSVNGLTNSLVRGTDFALMMTLRRTSTVVPTIAAMDVASNSEVINPGLNPVVTYDESEKVLHACLGTTSFTGAGAIDSDGKGVLNVLVGLDLLSTGSLSGDTFTGNDILYRSAGAVHYDLAVDTSLLPTRP